MWYLDSDRRLFFNFFLQVWHGLAKRCSLASPNFDPTRFIFGIFFAGLRCFALPSDGLWGMPRCKCLQKATHTKLPCLKFIEIGYIWLYEWTWLNDWHILTYSIGCMIEHDWTIDIFMEHEVCCIKLGSATATFLIIFLTNLNQRACLRTKQWLTMICSWLFMASWIRRKTHA